MNAGLPAAASAGSQQQVVLCDFSRLLFIFLFGIELGSITPSYDQTDEIFFSTCAAKEVMPIWAETMLTYCALQHGLQAASGSM
jgi:hypothetical protein